MSPLVCLCLKVLIYTTLNFHVFIFTLSLCNVGWFANLLSISLTLFYPFLYSVKNDFRDPDVILKILVDFLISFIHVFPLLPRWLNLFYLYGFLVLCAKGYISLYLLTIPSSVLEFSVTELDYFQGNTLWINLTLLAHPILHRTNIYFFLHIHEGMRISSQITFLSSGCSRSVPLGTLKRWSETSQVCSWCWSDLFLASRLSGCCLGHWNPSAWPSLLPLPEPCLHAGLIFLSLSETSVPARGCPNYPPVLSILPSSTSMALKHQSFSGLPRSMYYQFWPSLVPKTDPGWAAFLINFLDKRTAVSVKPTVLQKEN